MIRSFFGAVQYLTVIPIHFTTTSAGASAVFFPLVGAGIGAAGGLLFEVLRGHIPLPLAALVVLAFWSLLTGALHEDGFADCADAFRAYRSRHKIMEILKDSRVGAHGALALILLTLLRWQALTSTSAPPIQALAVAHGVSRAAIVALAWVTPPAGTGSGYQLSQTLTSLGAIAAILQGIALALYLLPSHASAVLGVSAIVVILAKRYFIARIGGFTGDSLGGTEQVLETLLLVLFSWRSFTS